MGDRSGRGTIREWIATHLVGSQRDESLGRQRVNEAAGEAQLRRQVRYVSLTTERFECLVQRALA